MIKMEILLDENKIRQDGVYDPADIKSHLDELFEGYHLKSIGNGVYTGTGANSDFAHFGSAILYLKKQDWFMSYVSKWVWDIDGTIEDVAEHYRLKPHMV